HTDTTTAVGTARGGHERKKAGTGTGERPPIRTPQRDTASPPRDGTTLPTQRTGTSDRTRARYTSADAGG
ncbi:hypothetical protein HispidOSU_029439, partial [Sigmodon hispidus]